MDDTDKRILTLLQRDCAMSLNEISERVHLSRNACWNRVRQLEAQGVITRRVALLDREQLNLDLTVFIAVRTNQHSAEWLASFRAAVRELPEITAIYRTTGETDYLLQAVVPNMKAYDALYQRIIDKVELTDVSSSFVMEEIKRTTELPLGYA
ncbi:MAG: Lrp/AsnC family transcriptional regulator [Hyphomicrobiales bacterium]